MKLFELAFACKLYGPFGDYDSSLTTFRNKVGPVLDVHNAEHRHALFDWLRSWGCRQFAKSHEGMAGTALRAWADRFLHALPASRVSLPDLSPVMIRNVAAAYTDLMARNACRQERETGPCLVTFGPAGAAKTLFALRPHSLPPWDKAIRDGLGYDESADSYARYLTDAQGHLRQVLEEAARFDISPDKLPAKLGRPNSSLAKLVDEYFWVTITNGCAIPGRKELQRWLLWASGEQGD